MKIDILVGHGKSNGILNRYDSGAVSGGFEEFQVAKEIAKYAHDYLFSNFVVDSSLINFDGTLSLNERISRYKKRSCADCILEIHLNSFHTKSPSGTEVWHYPGDCVGEGLAAKISSDLSLLFSIPNRGAKATNKQKFGIIDSTAPTALLVETCFISNPTDVAHVASADGQKNAGECIAKSIASFFTLEKRKTTTKPSNTYTVLPGDSFWKIARDRLGSGKRYNELARFNGMLATDTIFAGQILNLPD
ncbi:MAG: N-acetylmuramoyl-L-alanine amidase [Oscillospiraceae bacterium]